MTPPMATTTCPDCDATDMEPLRYEVDGKELGPGVALFTLSIAFLTGGAFVTAIGVVVLPLLIVGVPTLLVGVGLFLISLVAGFLSLFGWRVLECQDCGEKVTTLQGVGE